MADRSFGNPVPGSIGPEGGPGGSEGFLVTQGFGDEATDYGPHDGLDVANGKSGADILAMDAGTVYQAFFDTASGGAGIVRIDYGDGWTGGYAHMDQLYVSAGQKVTRGQRIARLDNTGWSSGAHLHMDTTYQNQRRDPWPLLAQNQEDSMIVEGYADRIDNRQVRTTDAAKFRLHPNTSEPELAVLGEGALVIPIARCKGQAVGTAPDKTDWYANVKTEGLPGDEAYLGYLHSSVLTRTKDGKGVQLDPIEDTGDEAGASKSAADAVRDAGVSALNTAAGKYGA